MSNLSASSPVLLPGLLLSMILGLGAACTTLAPLEFPPDGGRCQSDEVCKGDRICHQGQCVFPEMVRDAGQSDGGHDGGLIDAGGDGGLRDGGRPDGGGPDGGGHPPAPGELGGSCSGSGECVDAGAICVPDLPGGYCAIPGCRTCPAEGVCVLTDQGETVCVRACRSDADCRPDYACDASLGEPACLPSQGGGSTPVGGACTTASDCAGVPSYCIQDWPGGYCIHANCDACPAGTACVRDRDFAACMDSCETNQDCRPEYVCLSYQGTSFCFFGGP